MTYMYFISVYHFTTILILKQIYHMASCDRSLSILCFSSEILDVFVWNFRNIKNVFKLTPFRERLITMKLGDQQQI